MVEQDPIARAVRQLAAAIARTSAVEVRSDAESEARRTDAALGRAREALGRGEVRAALAEIDAAIGASTQLSPEVALRLDARALGALAPPGGGPRRLCRLFRLRASVLDACGLEEEALRAREIAHALSRRR